MILPTSIIEAVARANAPHQPTTIPTVRRRNPHAKLAPTSQVYTAPTTHRGWNARTLRSEVEAEFRAAKHIP